MNPAFTRLLDTLCVNTRDTVADLIRGGMSIDRLRADPGYQLLAMICTRYEEQQNIEVRRAVPRHKSRAEERAHAAMPSACLASRRKNPPVAASRCFP